MNKNLVKSQEFKDSPLGKIPNNWDIVPLKEYIFFQEGPGLRHWQFTETGVRFLNIRCFKTEKLDLSVAQFIAESEAFGSYQHFLLDTSDFVMSSSGTLGRIVEIHAEHLPLMLNTSTIRFRPLSASVDKRFLWWILQSDGFFAQVFRESQGSAQINFGPSHLAKTLLLLPPLSEQKRIAEILDTVDETIALTTSVIAKLKQIRAGLLHDLLTRGLDEDGKLRDAIAHPEQFKDSPLGRIPKNWKVQPLSELADVDRGKFTHRPRNDPHFYGGLYPFVQTGDIAKAVGEILTTYSQTLNERGITVSCQFPVDSIAITIAANIADTAILGIPMFFPDSIVGAIVKPPNNVRYIELCIRSAKQQLDANAPQSAQKNINLADLRPLLIAVANPKEQTKIAEVYEFQNNRILTEEVYLDKLKLQKKGLMHDLLTGKVRVNQI